MGKCLLCPRGCSVDRAQGETGFCKEAKDVTISRAALHLWEEPPISGSRGSGTIFFCGCNLHCVFCQNKLISRGGGNRKTISVNELASLMLEVRDMGAHNINLVTPTHFADSIAEALTLIRDDLNIPIVYNSSGYENISTLKMLDGLIDVYLPDFKYASSELARDYSSAPDYTEVAAKALCEMHRQVGSPVFDENGIIQRGMIVRHLVLPSCRHDSIKVLDILAELFSPDSIKLSLMSQYTPDFALDTPFKNLHRKLTSFEYNSVLEHAISLGSDGYFQSLSSATSRYTPNFEGC